MRLHKSGELEEKLLERMWDFNKHQLISFNLEWNLWDFVALRWAGGLKEMGNSWFNVEIHQ
jgi:hypothetical protein